MSSEARFVWLMSYLVHVLCLVGYLLWCVGALLLKFATLVGWHSYIFSGSKHILTQSLAISISIYGIFHYNYNLHIYRLYRGLSMAMLITRGYQGPVDLPSPRREARAGESKGSMPDWPGWRGSAWSSLLEHLRDEDPK
jgi:hypothetical protein